MPFDICSSRGCQNQVESLAASKQTHFFVHYLNSITTSLLIEKLKKPKLWHIYIAIEPIIYIATDLIGLFIIIVLPLHLLNKTHKLGSTHSNNKVPISSLDQFLNTTLVISLWEQSFLIFIHWYLDVRQFPNQFSTGSFTV